MAKTIKLSDEFVEVAGEEGRVMHRSISAQVEYWARLGRRVEALGVIGPRALRNLLRRSDSARGDGAKDDEVDLGLLRKKLEALDGSDTRILEDLRAGGHPIASEDEQGNVVVEGPIATKEAAR